MVKHEDEASLLTVVEQLATNDDEASRQITDRLRDFLALMSLPVPQALRAIGPQLTHLATTLVTTDHDERADLCEKLESLLDAAEGEARGALGDEIVELEARARAALQPGALPPLVGALHDRQSDGGPIDRTVSERRTMLTREVQHARMVYERIVPTGQIVKAVERARLTAREFPSHANLKAAGSWRRLGEPGGLFEVVNAAYYRARGSTIYDDFDTLVGSDPTLARADAIDFARTIDGATRAGRSLPDPLGVVEVGIGSGAFAGSFLDALAEGAPALYERVRYYLCDVSARMLDQAMAGSRLAAHRERLVAVESDGVPDELPDGVRPVFCRFFELFTDLPGTEIVYRDHDGALQRLAVRPAIRGERPLRRCGGGEVPANRVLEWVDAGDVDSLATLEPDDLARVDWQGRFEPLAVDNLPAVLDPEFIFFGRTDLVLPLPLGAMNELVAALALLDSDLGWLRLSDYGFVEAGNYNRSLPALCQVVRRYGANLTVNLHFPLMAAVAATLERDVTITPTSRVVSEAIGERACPIPPYYARTGTVNVQRDVSGPTPLLPLDALSSWKELKGCAESLEDALSYGASPDPEVRTSQWQQLVTMAEHNGWLRSGVRLDDGAPWLPLLESLARELDFVVNSVFVRYGSELLAGGREWYGRREIVGIANDLVRIGWKREAVDRAIEATPSRIRFWTLTVRARSRQPF